MTSNRRPLLATLLPVLLALLRLVLAPGPTLAGAAPTATVPDTLADSTVVEHWTLANGLRVTTRHLPRGAAVAITVGYAVGSDDDPPGHEGLAQVMCDLGFTAPAGDVPERTREELSSQRPLGWSFMTTRHATLFTEIASLEQFPGVLAQVANRMRGVQVTREALQATVRDVHTELEQQVYGPPTVSLYYMVRDVARDKSDEAILRRAAGRDLDRLTPAKVSEFLRRLYVPANAALSLVGNLEGLDVRALVENLFGALPAGTRIARTAPDSLRARARVVQLARPGPRAGAIGIIAPPLSDTLHASFYLHSMLLGSHFNQAWRSGSEPATASHFHYAIFDEPDLVRLFPPVAPKNATPEGLANELSETISALYRVVITRESYDELRSGLLWLLGGPMDDATRSRLLLDIQGLHTLARSMAARELMGGETFWAEYRRRFAAVPAGGLEPWMTHYDSPQHQVRVVTRPAAPRAR